jgi:glucose/arabinose dehydrogenase
MFTHPRRVIRSLVALSVIAAVAAESGSVGNAEEARTPTPRAPVRAAAAPTLTVNTLVSGLDHPWDITFTPGGSMLFTQRDRGTVNIRRTNGRVRTLVSNVPGLWASGETGLMGITVDPRFSSNRRFYLCHGFENGRTGRHDVRVTAWRANDALTSASQVDVLVKGIRATSGRHGGCRMRFGGSDALYIGTGDAAIAGSARDLNGYNGKVLKVNAANGNALRNNPFFFSTNKRTRKIWTLGHRNVQGLALRPGGAMWSVEHGPNRDDEINRLRPGGDYGWEAGPGYDENRPMTDFSLPGAQVGARWSSGFPTVAPSGAAWLTHNRWGSWKNRLAVAFLKDQSVRFFQFDRDGDFVRINRPGLLAGDFGRLRAAQLGPDGRLYLSTDNGGGADRIIVVTPHT